MQYLLKEGKDSSKFQWYFSRFLRSMGFSVTWEAPIQYQRPDGKMVNGRIDLLAVKDGLRVAYELDHSEPRKKSVVKLKNFPCDEAWVVCRKTGVIVKIK